MTLWEPSFTPLVLQILVSSYDHGQTRSHHCANVPSLKRSRQHRRGADSLRQHREDVSDGLHGHRRPLAPVHRPHPALVQEVT